MISYNATYYKEKGSFCNIINILYMSIIIIRSGLSSLYEYTIISIDIKIEYIYSKIDFY